MVQNDRDTIHLIATSNNDEAEQNQFLHSTFPRSISIISYNNNSNITIPPKQVFDVLNQIYDDRTHRKCVLSSYLTLISMTLAIISWMTYWIVYNRSENTKDDNIQIFLSDLATILETLTFALLGMTPVLFIIMIILWIRYSCYNPMDSIREDGKLIRIENEQWKNQLNYFYHKKIFRLFNCFHSKQKNELNERGYGYIILSSHGIVIDELLLLSAQRNLIDHAILSDNGQYLELTFKRTCSNPFRFHVSIYLSDNLTLRDDFIELKQILQIQNNTF